MSPILNTASIAAGRVTVDRLNAARIRSPLPRTMQAAGLHALQPVRGGQNPTVQRYCSTSLMNVSVLESTRLRWRQSAVRLSRAVLAIGLLTAGVHARADTVDARCDIYPKGSDQASKVVACTFSQRQGFVSIDRADGVRHELSPRRGVGNYRDQDGQRAVRSMGLGRAGQIYRLAHETVYVYWDTAGLPERAASAPVVAALPITPTAVSPTVPFDQSLEWQGIGFRVTSANLGPRSELMILPRGLSVDNSPVVRSIDAQIVRAEVADLNADGSPEIYIYLTSADPSAHGSLVAYSTNHRKSLSDIHLPLESQALSRANGYRGHDEFGVVENTLVRRFPVYKDSDTDGAPTGGMRQFQYKLKPGEASWVLQLDRVVSY